MRKNHVAVFAYGLLCAMEQRVPADVITGTPYQYFQQQIDQLKGADDREVFVTLMERYRAQVKVAAEHGRIEFDIEELQQQLRDAERGDRGSMVNMLDSGLTLYHGYHVEEISFRSIFADFEESEDDLGLIHAAREYLRDLKALADKADIQEGVMKALAELKAQDGRGMDATETVNSFVNARDPRANLIKMGALVCCWLEEYVRAGGKRVPAKDITVALGFKENVQVHDILRRAGFECPLGHFLQLLASRPLGLPSLYNCAARYWDQLSKPKGLAVPGCLQQPEEKVRASSAVAANEAL